jgi:deoxyribonuclease-4
MPKQLLGAHLSIAGGLHLALELAVRLGCECVQIFVKNQQQWSAKPLTDEQIRLFRQSWRRTGIQHIVAHAGYLPNIASPHTKARRKSLAAVVDELQRCEVLGVRYLVLHPGSHLGAGMEAGIKNVVASLDEIHRRTAGFRASLLLETTAGQGGSIGHAFWQLGRIVGAVTAPRRVGVCLDTCHLYAAGYNLADPDGYESTIAELSAEVGLRKVRCIHVNDSRTTCGSRVDRHEHIGKGRMGKQAFVHLLNDSRFARVPKILETPKGVNGRGTELDRVNLRRLRRLIAQLS